MQYMLINVYMIIQHMYVYTMYMVIYSDVYSHVHMHIYMHAYV